MVSVPYLSLGVMSVLIYRGCKKNAAYFEALEQQQKNNNPADSLRSSAGLGE